MGIKQAAAQGNHKISGAPKIEIFAEKEMKRMKEIISNVKVISSGKKALHFIDVRNAFISEQPKIPNLAKEFYDFARNYFKDGIYFFNEKKFIESFEAFIISWAYIDAGLKLKFFKVPKAQKKWFTV